MIQSASPSIWLLLLSWSLPLAHSLSLNQCSTQNIGSNVLRSEYMSNGACITHCRDLGYLVAIVQEFYCWCSNNLPLSTTETSNCNAPCPGFPYEHCARTGYFGYLVVSGNPLTLESSSTSSKTLSTSTSSTTSTSSKSSTTPPSTSLTSPSSTSTSSYPTTSSTSSSSTEPETSSTETSSSATSSLELSSTSSSSSSSSLSTSSESSSSSLVYATTLYSTKTVNGVVSQLLTTQYITTYASTTPTATSTPTATPTSTSKSFFDSKGKVAGTFTAVGVVIVALIGGIIWCCCFAGGRHGDDNDGDGYSDEEKSVTSFSKPIPYIKPHSNTPTPPLGAPVTPLKRSSTGKVLLSKLTSSTANNNNNSAGKSGSDAGGSGLVGRSLSRRKLKEDFEDDSNKVLENIFPILEHDTRLDPMSLFAMQVSNTSKTSFGDDVDYSRKLKVIN